MAEAWCRAVAARSSIEVEYRLRRPDGSYSWTIARATPVLNEDGSVREWIGTNTDITESRRAEEERQATLRELMALYEIGRALSAELDLEKLLQALTDASVQITGARFGAFFYNAADERGGHFLLYTLSGAPREDFEKLGIPRNTDLFAATFAGTGVVRLDDVKKDSRYGTNAPHFGIPLGHLPVASYLAVPVVGRSREVFGGLFLGHPEPAVFTEKAERIALGLAAQGAIAIDNARLYEAERRARSEAEAANRAKDEFLAMLGHELRNPLSAVRNALVTARLDPSRRERAQEIACRQTDKLARLVDDLLDVARITKGKVSLRVQSIGFASILERAVETARPLIEGCVHRLSLSLPRADVQVHGDPIRVEQAVVNLISNAAKFTEPGGLIELSAEREGREVVLSVRDNGVGIAPHMLPRVFELFEQADRGLSRARGGLGIGLTVARRLVELHGGRIEVRSDGLGTGTEAVVHLPALLLAPEAGEKPRVETSYNGRAHVLLVEDDPDGGEALMTLLELLGYRVRLATDGRSALDFAQVNVPDVMLVDIGLPRLDGYEVARNVRQNSKLGRVVLIALTGYSRNKDKQKAIAAGFDYHLAKPVEIGTLQALLARVSAQHHRHD